MSHQSRKNYFKIFWNTGFFVTAFNFSDVKIQACDFMHLKELLQNRFIDFFIHTNKFMTGKQWEKNRGSLGQRTKALIRAFQVAQWVKKLPVMQET